MTVAYLNLARRDLAMIVARGATLAVIAVALAGCYTARETVQDVPNDYRLRHPISIQEGERKISLFIGTNRGGLNPTQRAEVLAFAQSWKRESTGGIVVDVPTGTANERAAADAVHDVQAILMAASIPPHAYSVRPYRPSEAGKLAPIKINYPRIVADAGPCGLWPNDLGPAAGEVYLENRPYWNHGCSLQRNLAAMVDNPADLVQPRGETAAYTPRRTQVLDHYRKGEYGGTTYPNENKGKISDVGQ